ncbi:SRPBCC family protein [Demequina sp.]|uniref:SRPBCC family protein n=1 Tax=Demequina sp. TaxID=2050685 RepID=UPI003D10DB73
MIKISFEATHDPACLTVTELMPYPLARVWLAQTEGLYVQQWWAPTDYENVEVDITTAEGGAWRILQRDPQGNQFSFYGKVETVEPERQLVISIVSELFPESTIRLTQDFAARDAGTVVVSTYEFESDEALGTYMALGGTERLREASSRLDALLAQMGQ